MDNDAGSAFKDSCNNLLRKYTLFYDKMEELRRRVEFAMEPEAKDI
jgi:hypothetical protein